MKEIQVSYTILDTIKVPDEWTEEEIDKYLQDNWFDNIITDACYYNDMEWNEV